MQKIEELTKNFEDDVEIERKLKIIIIRNYLFSSFLKNVLF